MKYTLLTLSLVIAISGSAFAQKSADSKTRANSQASATAGKGLDIQSGTQMAADLQSTLDVKSAKVGDQVVLRTTRAIKQNGQVVVEKGSKLIGRVTEVQQKAKGNADSRIGVFFDHLQNSSGSLMPITATIMSITQARSTMSVGDDMQSDTYATSSTRATTSSSSSPSGGGGLLGGIGNSVGNVANTTSQTTGNVVNAVGQTTSSVVNNAGSAVGATTGSLKGLNISQSADASAQGGSTLSLSGGSLRLEKGTTFNLAVSGSSSVKNN